MSAKAISFTPPPPPPPSLTPKEKRKRKKEKEKKHNHLHELRQLNDDAEAGISLPVHGLPSEKWQFPGEPMHR